MKNNWAIKKRVFFLTIIVIILMLLFLKFGLIKHITFFNLGDYASLYFFSALFQGNAALITLTAMFVIYKSQTLENKAMKIEEIVITYFKSAFHITLNYGNILQLENYNGDLFAKQDEGAQQKIKETMESEHWKARFNEIKNLQKEISKLWKNARPSILGIFTALILSVILLPLSNVIHKNNILEIVLISAIIVLEIISIQKLYIFIKKQLIS